jgi:hypothetical protein
LLFAATVLVARFLSAFEDRNTDLIAIGLRWEDFAGAFAVTTLADARSETASATQIDKDRVRITRILFCCFPAG